MRVKINYSVEEADSTRLIVEGLAISVRELYAQFVLGTIDPRALHNSGSYDYTTSDMKDVPDFEAVDPSNSVGMSYEQVYEHLDRGNAIAQELGARQNVEHEGPAPKASSDAAAPKDAAAD